MFKKAKDLTERSQSLLKNKDCRKLRQDILQQFPNLSDAQLSEIIPNKCQVVVIKLASKSMIYLIDEIPYFFDNSGRNILYPTVFFIWRFPHTIKALSIHSPVSEFILNGADLMLPGVCFVDEFLTVKKDEKVCICVHGNPLPFAIGNCLVNHEYIMSNGLQGKAVEVLHQFGDVLWGMTPHIKSNEGFAFKRIYPLSNLNGSNNNNDNNTLDEEPHKDNIDITKKLQDLQLTTEVTENATFSCDTIVNNEVDMIIDNKNHDKNKDDSEDDVETQIKEVDYSNDNDDGNDNVPVNANDTHNTTTNIVPPPPPMNIHSHASSTTSTDKQTMDAWLLESLLLNLKYVIKDTLLPILVSTLWNMLLRSSAYPSQPCLDIKQSSYKKVSVFLKHTHQLGLLTLIEKGGVATIIAIQRSHDLYRGITIDNPETFRTFVLHATTTTTSTSNDSLGISMNMSTSMIPSGEAPSSKGNNNNNKMKVIELYKLNKSAKELIGTTHGQYGECLTLAEVRVHLMEYIRNLTPPPPPSHSPSPVLSLSSEANELTTNSSSPILTASISNSNSSSSCPTVISPSPTDQHAKDQVWLPFTDRLGTFLYGNEWVLGTYHVSPTAMDPPLLPVPPTNISKSSKKKIDSKPETEFDILLGMKDSEEYFDSTCLEGDVTNNMNNHSHQSNASIVGGVLVSSISKSNSNSNRSDSTSTASKNNTYMGNNNSLSDFPTLSQSHQFSPSTSGNTAPSSTIRGSSSIGGWGVDKGKVWAPVSLSSAPLTATTTATATAMKKQKEELNKKDIKAKSKAVAMPPAQSTKKSFGPPTSIDPTKSVTVSGQWIKKEDIIKSFLTKLSSAHVVINSSGVPKVSNGKPPVVHVEVEKRMGNKLVTRVRGLEALGFDHEMIAKDCQKKFACSSTVSEIVGQSKGETELVIQGNFIDEIPEFLCVTYNIPKGLVTSKSSSGIPKKKKK